MFRALRRFPGAVWCVLAHNPAHMWTLEGMYWSGSDYRCSKCGREWRV